jgi:hypothetical protein
MLASLFQGKPANCKCKKSIAKKNWLMKLMLIKLSIRFLLKGE